MIGKWEKIKTLKTQNYGKWYKIVQDEVLTPGNKKVVYRTIRGKLKSVMIIAIDSYNKLHLTRQHRYPINDFVLCFPAGFIEKDETVLEAAKRELLEEMQLKSREWSFIGKYFQSPGIANLEVSVFLARNCKKIKTKSSDPLDDNLHESVIIGYKDLKELISKNKIKDSNTLSVFALAESSGMFNSYKK